MLKNFSQSVPSSILSSKVTITFILNIRCSSKPFWRNFSSPVAIRRNKRCHYEEKYHKYALRGSEACQGTRRFTLFMHVITRRLEFRRLPVRHVTWDWHTGQNIFWFSCELRVFILLAAPSPLYHHHSKIGALNCRHEHRPFTIVAIQTIQLLRIMDRSIFPVSFIKPQLLVARDCLLFICC